MMKRRDFITFLGGAVTAWPLAARSQQGERMRRIGALMPYDENDPVAKANISAFMQALAGLGWTEGRNVRMDLRWGGDDTNRIRAVAQELVGLQPERVIFSTCLDLTHTSGSTDRRSFGREDRAPPVDSLEICCNW